MVRMTTLHCPRCGWRLPYFRSRRSHRHRTPWTGLAAPMSMGKACPRCHAGTSRRHTPAWLKPIRALLGEARMSYRRCERCHWSGPALHAPTPPAPRPIPLEPALATMRETAAR
ncbi:MAG TPA: hypothetical protein VFQ39_07040 [Longimicrobium sp.]|nr:hypothetical protein [Longimicrobium sp.]